MFTQNDTYSPLPSRISDISIDSSKKNYGPTQFNICQFDVGFPGLGALSFTPMLSRNKSSELERDPEFYLRSERPQLSSNPFMAVETFISQTFCPEEQDFCFAPQQKIVEDSTHDSQATMKMSSNEARTTFTMSPSNSDLEDIMALNEDNLIQNLLKSKQSSIQDSLEEQMNYIFETPLKTKRQKKQIEAQLKKEEMMNEMNQDEKRRRKNKDQVKYLQEQYAKNPNWSKTEMKELAKKTGLKQSQIYKWLWDENQKKKELQKALNPFYPNQIFQVTDKKGNNISKPLPQKFQVSKTF